MKKKGIRFFKVVGSGNDFILVDTRKSPLATSAAGLAVSSCNRKKGIGADGLLLVASSRSSDARMRIFNPDGSEADMCGNGLRCVAWYLHTKDHGRRRLSVETGAGILRTEVVGTERVRITLTPPRDLRFGIRLSLKGTRLQLHSVNTGVPHAVCFVEELNRIDLPPLGQAIRSHRLFQPAGTNVDFVRILSRHRIALRTYERGVEAETLACGTGAVAAVVVGAALGKLESPVEVKTASGELLTVSFGGDRFPWDRLCLEGQSQILFEGIFRCR